MDYTKPASALARKLLIVDGHVDLPMRLARSMKDGKLTEDVSERTEGGHFDHRRAYQGGLDAAFMAIYVEASYQESGGARQRADKLIDLIEGLIAAHPDKFAKAHSPADVRQNFADESADKRISLPLGLENGAAIEDDLANLKHFYDRGIRYVTLTHSKNNQICDSSYDDTDTWKGLSPFGTKVIAEMNRLGLMIDVSHVSDETFYQVLDLTKAPVIASHSSARHFTPDFERNMSDAMIAKIKDNGGVVMINFGAGFISKQARDYSDERRKAGDAYAKDKGLDWASDEMRAWRDEYAEQHPVPAVTVKDVADHVDHAVKLAGIDHVGFGSDFDGVTDLPEGLSDASMYPNLIGELLARGYSEADIEKLCSGNVLRVWQAVADYAAAQAK